MPPAPGRPPLRLLLAAIALLAVQGALLLATARDKSDTIDEPHYLALSVVQWHEGHVAADSPALPRWGFALALRLSDPALFDDAGRTGRHPLWSRPGEQMRKNLLAGRLATIAATLSSGLALWLAARRWSEGAALFSLALWCLSPNLLAHGSLATLDAWLTAMLAWVAWGLLRLLERPAVARAAVLGALLGAAAACKVTALATLAVVLPLVAVAAWRAGRARGLATFLAALAAAALLVLWAVHGFTVGTIDTGFVFGRPTGLPQAHLTLPFHEWFEGLVAQVAHGRSGHVSYLFGETKAEGWWWFYLAVLVLKTTLGVQALALLRLVSWARAKPTREALLADALLLAFPLFLFTAMSLGSTQMGIRYILPAAPLALVWLGRGFDDAFRAFGRVGHSLAVAALLAGAVEMLSVHPHHLMFFNRWAGGPEGGPRYLIVGDDWGQDQRRLAEWQQETRPTPLFYTYYGGQPGNWGITYRPPACEPKVGYHALHAVEVHRPKRVRPGCLDWLTVEPPDERLGYSIYIYAVNKARIERLRAEREAGLTPFATSARAAVD